MNHMTLAAFRQLPSPAGRDGVEAFVEPAPVETDAASLRDYWQAIRKHLWLIAACCFGAIFATVLVLLMMTPIYTAETTLLIERQTPQVLNIQEVVSEPLMANESDFYKTQYEILKSRTLAAWTIKEQGLETNSLFTGEGENESVVAKWRDKVKGWLNRQWWASRFFPPPPAVQAEDALGVKPAIIEAYLGMLEIIPVQRTRLVKLAFNTRDPALSASLANAHALAYIRHGLGLRTQTNEDAEQFLEGKLAELKGRVERSEEALNRYRRDKKMISLGDKENIVIDRLADLNKRLTEAETNRIALEAQVRLIRRRDYDSLPAVMNSGLIQNLKEQLGHLEGDNAYLSTQFKPGYPRLDQLQAQVKETRRRLTQEVQQVVAGIESSYRVAVTEEKELRAKMEQQKAEALTLKDASVKYTILAREVDTNRQLYDSVLQRVKEMGVAAQLRASNVFIIDKAQAPSRPSKPAKRKILLLSALLGLLGGVGLALVAEYLDNTLETPEEVERYIRLPNLSVVPDFLSLDWRRYAPRNFPRAAVPLPGPLPAGEEPGLALSYRPLLMVTEAYRGLRTAILLSRAEEPPKTILITSAAHGEGKTATVVNTAIVFAQMGVRVLVIDADLRRPQCHTLLGVDNGPGLTEVLTGHRGPLEVISPTVSDHLFLLSAGSLPPNPTELVGSHKMREMLAALREHYDYILIDSPPVMPVSDAVLLSTIVEGVALVVNGRETPKQVLREACARLSYARAKMLGTVFNRADIRKRSFTYYYQPYNSYNDHTATGVHRN